MRYLLPCNPFFINHVIMDTSILLIIIVSCYVGIALACSISADAKNEPHALGKGCIWPFYLVVHNTKAWIQLIQNFKTKVNSFKNSNEC
jgi:L-cystine uptake protein TcyP (sodium:dicarboxylate symporter family)